MFIYGGDGHWERAEAPRTAIEVHELRVLSLNVWFDWLHQAERRRALLELIEREDADLVVLAEMRSETLAGVLGHEFVRERYTTSVTSIAHPAGYDVVLLSKLPPVACARHPLVSVYARSCYTFTFATTTGRLDFAGAHLESGVERHATRLEQVEAMTTRLADAAQVVFAGDMNFEPRSDEDRRLGERGYVDAWETLNPSDPGFTRDTVTNRMAARAGAAKQRRIDHVYLRGPGLVPKSMRLVGTEPIDSSGEIFVSDHFGLSLELERR